MAALAISSVSSQRIESLVSRERERFAAAHPESRALAEQSRAHWLNGVPMHWMLDWGTAYPLFVRSAEGVHLVDADGHEYIDFCLGDTGAMFGHSPPPVTRAIVTQAARGLTCMLPAERVADVGARLSELFGLPYWQIAQTATDANRYALRWCRAVTGRGKILAFQGCYHGTVDETLVRLIGGRTVPRPGLIGPVFDNAAATTLVEFNDLAALERELTTRQYACVIAEPVMTNIGMVLPVPGYLAALRELTRRTETLLLIDETHTLSSGLGGYTGVHGLAPDLLVCGKAIAGGLPCAVFGFTAEVDARIQRLLANRAGGHSGMGTTLAANPLAVAALDANLTQVMMADTYALMLASAERLERELARVFAAHRLNWHIARVGARLEFGFAAQPPRNGTESEAAMRPELEQAMHLYLLNRGLLLTPFHNMMLCSPLTTAAHVERLASEIEACLGELGVGASVTH
jgi:glutamate-1-semialdehyde 2,1-aminomutase